MLHPVFNGPKSLGIKEGDPDDIRTRKDLSSSRAAVPNPARKEQDFSATEFVNMFLRTLTSPCRTIADAAALENSKIKPLVGGDDASDRTFDGPRSQRTYSAQFVKPPHLRDIMSGRPPKPQKGASPPTKALVNIAISAEGLGRLRS